MIKVYASRHPINLYPHDGQPLESHTVSESVTLADWLNTNVKGFDLSRESHPINIDVDGQLIEPSDWALTYLSESSDFRIYPSVGDPATLIWIAIAVVAAVAVYTLTSLPDPLGGQQQGDDLATGRANANRAALYDPVPELLGSTRVYPYYLLQPVTRFAGPRDLRTQMFLCVTAGAASLSQLKIGNTPASAFGADVDFDVYQPAVSVAADPRSENWYVAPEVGASKSATAGLDLDSPVDVTASVADGLALDGYDITLLGNSAEIYSGWVNGTIVTLVTPNNYLVSSDGGYSVISGPLDDLQPFVGMQVSLAAPTVDFILTVSTYSPYVAPVPGSGGSPSFVIGSSAPSTYDFTLSPVAWSITYQSVTTALSLSANYVTMSGLIAEINSQLTGTGLAASDSSGLVRIGEPSSPYQGGVISQLGAPVSVFGASPAYTTGSASSGGTPEQLAFIKLEYFGGAPFSGLPNGLQRLALGYSGNQFVITDIDDLTISLDRLDESGLVDSGWMGFDSRTLLDFSLSAVASVNDNWIGPFLVCPEGEVVDRIEWDMFFPSGIIHVDKKGRDVQYAVLTEIEWADVDDGIWNSINKTYFGMTRDGFGKTEGINFGTPIRPMMRMRKREYKNWSNSQDKAQWFGLRGRLLNRPTSYEGMTCLALTIRTGDRLSAASDRQVNCVASRLYDALPTSSIHGAVDYICTTGGMTTDEIDSDTLADLQSIYWTPRAEKFDKYVTKQMSIREMLQASLAAGMSVPLFESGMISAVRDGIKPFTGMITPHEQTTELKIQFKSPNVDDYSGVDIKYIDPVRYTEEIVECRIDGLFPAKIETYTVEGVQNRTIAWRIGMRRLMKHQKQRLTCETGTEMEALVYRYNDHLVFTSDIPGDKNISCLMLSKSVAAGVATITVSETLDWSFASPRVIVRRQDGTATGLLTPTQVSEYSFTLPASSVDFIINDAIEPPRVLFCSSVSTGYHMSAENIEPDPDGRCTVRGVQYSEEFYQYDDQEPE